MNNFTVIITDDLFLRRILEIVKAINKDVAKTNVIMREEIEREYLKRKIVSDKERRKRINEL